MANRWGYSEPALFSKFTIHRKALCSCKNTTLKLLRGVLIRGPGTVPEYSFAIIATTHLCFFQMNLPKCLEVTSREWHCHEGGAWVFTQKGQHLSGYWKPSFRNIIPSWNPVPHSNYLDHSVSRYHAQFNRYDIIQVAMSPCRNIKTRWLRLVWWSNTAKKLLPILCSSWGHMLEDLSSFLTFHRLVRGWEIW